MELLFLISYFIRWMHYPNTATNCAFDMHREEGERERGREAGRQRETGMRRERKKSFFSAGTVSTYPCHHA